MTRVLEEFRKLIRINSETSRGNEELISFLECIFQDRGFKINVQHVTHSHESLSKRQFNVIGILGDPLVDRKIKKGLMLGSHLDTVGPGRVKNWSETNENPFELTLNNGTVFGLGIADAKIDFLCKLMAASKYRERKLKQPIYVVGTCGQENGMIGAKYLLQSRALNPKFAMIGTPSALSIVTSHKSHFIFKITMNYQLVERDPKGFNRKITLISTGRNAHSAFPESGQNAILSLIEFLRQSLECGFEFRFTKFVGGDMVTKVPDHAEFDVYLNSHQLEDFKKFFQERGASLSNPHQSFDLNLCGVEHSGLRFLPESLFSSLLEIIELLSKMEKDFKKLKENNFNPPYSTINLGQIRQYKNHLEMFIDLRLLPGLAPEEVEEHVKREIKSIAAHYPQLNISVNCEHFHPALKTREDSEWMGICKESLLAANIPSQQIKISPSTEASLFAQAGYDVFAFGPGETKNNAHGPDEHCFLGDLDLATTFYEKLIEKVCL